MFHGCRYVHQNSNRQPKRHRFNNGSPGERFHAGGLKMSVPMKANDLVGVLVDLRSVRLDHGGFPKLVSRLGCRWGSRYVKIIQIGLD